MAYFQIPLHHSLLSTALNPRSPLAKEKTGSSSKDAQIPLDVSCLSTSSGQIGLGARGEHKSSLSTACHSLPNRPKLVAAQLLSREFVSWLQNLWCMHQTGWLKAQASIAPITGLLHSTPQCSRNLAIWSAWHLPAVRGVHPCPHHTQCGLSAMHQNASSAHSPECTVFAPKFKPDKCRTVFP